MKRSALQSMIDMLLPIREPMNKSKNSDGETGALEIRGLEFVFDYNGDLIMIKGPIDGSADIKTVIKDRLEKRVKIIESYAICFQKREAWLIKQVISHWAEFLRWRIC